MEVTVHNKAAILGVSSYLPTNRLTNEQLAIEYPDWSVDKIFEKTGIKSRPIASKEDSCSSMAIEASKRLFEKLNVEPSCIDYVLLCTQSPDFKLPTTACIVQNKLGIPTTAGALDFNLGCSGYVYGLSLAKGLIESGQSKNVLLITSELYSRYINDQDKSVRTLFGDAATATLIGVTESNDEYIGGIVLGSDGAGDKNLIVPHGGSLNPIVESSNFATVDSSGNCRSLADLYMNGAEILTFTLKAVPKLVASVLSKSNLEVSDVDKVVFHQANKFMLDKLRKKTQFTEQQFLVSYEHYGNTVSSTIPLGLELAQSEGRLKSGDNVLLCGFGVGYSWAGAMIKWSDNA
ncbi:ketoacyl-ACP synthase III [Vibrio sp. 070316B]|nr:MULTISPECIES: ketoacyl-ACP synthase III [unclassified Vibrio]CAH6859862.1 3-oxoacyl-(acyl-carrier-protein) synthase, KASIII [Vibrio chagasii]NOI37756.1 ketoacyl-ACP synthase III [Vibrio sp. 070316B]NOI88648.1 ketoacyl-ACP synthase III [Vibrio sp. 99K-1]CAH7076276.1 3-oxoacyl-(acyl-carrier-protein) synthase, KASIII [Vibrio chagasii]CAH7131887.1 3-oxoacyl-(acyl-carrier-protein) synthase, KASIII [Vibrio chagasii]